MTKYEAAEYFMPAANIYRKVKNSGFNMDLNGCVFIENISFFTNNHILGVVETDVNSTSTRPLFFAFSSETPEENQIQIINSKITPVSLGLFSDDVLSEIKHLYIAFRENHVILAPDILLNYANQIGDKSKHRFDLHLSSDYSSSKILCNITENKTSEISADTLVLRLCDFDANIRITQPFHLQLNLLYFCFALRAYNDELVHLKFDSCEESPVIFFSRNSRYSKICWAIAQHRE